MTLAIRRREIGPLNACCTVRVKRLDGEAHTVEGSRPASFDELIALLKRIRDRHADGYAEMLAAESDPGDWATRDLLGGFGVEVENRWGDVAAAGLGRDACFLVRIEPRPMLCYSDHPPIDGARVFYLDGGHISELRLDILASPATFLRVLRHWLDEGVFPERDHA